jgi:hypothetical protein
MASGNHSLLLTEAVGWDVFPVYAEQILRCVGGAVVRRTDGPVERVWHVTIGGQPFWLAYDDHPLGISLDAQNDEASALIPDIRHRLLAHRTRAEAAG